jgi:hypothetical protein
MAIHTTRQRGHPRVAALVLAALLGSVPVSAQSPASPPAEPVPDVEAKGVLPEPHVIARGIDFATRTVGNGTDVKNGFYVDFSNMPTGAGWISAGPGYRRWMTHDRVVVEGSAALSWRSYKMAQVRIELPRLARSRLAVGAQVRWQDLTQVTYFGDGPDTAAADRSEYRLKTGNVLAYGTVRPVRWLALTGRGGWLVSPSVLRPAGTFKRGNPATQDLFPDDPVFAIDTQPDYAYAEASAVADRRDHRSHATRGGFYRAAWSIYSDRDRGTFGFHRSEVEAAQFVPLAGSRVVLAAHGWLVDSTPSGAGIPFYLQTSLGGANTLRGYTDFRFHGDKALVVNGEVRIALMTHVDAALFADAGNVAARLADLDVAKRSYGVGLRMHSHQSTFARVDVAHGDEGWRLQFRMNDPLHFARLSRRTAAAPVAP